MIQTISGGLVVVVEGDDRTQEDDSDDGIRATLVPSAGLGHRQPLSSTTIPMIVRRPSVRRQSWSWDARTSVRELCCVSCASGSVEGDVCRDRSDASQALSLTDQLISSSSTANDALTSRMIASRTQHEDQYESEDPISTNAVLVSDLQQAQVEDSTESPVNGIAGVGYRLGLRNSLSERRKRIADYSLVCALFGLGVVVAETEMSMAEIYDKVSCYLSADK